ncbi:unnamed protein product [Paramecium sonneborni]|uniref:Uncharacterized protein n=1 Tax=Paramecium sonneborni TaxID=65129 RepID=A0A8S1RR14_9CILI|nr:unnamed protein product [Paramecium sonneborni]
MIEQQEQQEIEQNYSKKQQNDCLAIIDPNLKYNYNDLHPTQLQTFLGSLLSGKIIKSSLTNNDILYWCRNQTQITNQFILMVHYAYYNHFPLRFSPDDIQLLINQGFCAHIKNNAEYFRKKFVQHEGKMKLSVFVESEDINTYDWESIINNFSNQIKANIPNEKYKLCVQKYSTTNQISKTCYEVSLMDAMKKYFEYTMDCGCGISKIKLLGTLEDWECLRKNAEKLQEFELGDWLDRILPILDQFINLYKGKIDYAFWKDIYRYQPPQSPQYDPTPQYATGWITNFFPYRINESADIYDQENKFVKNYFSKSLKKNSQFQEKQIPTGISQAQVILQNIRTHVTMNLKFNAGFFGVAKDQDGFLYAQQGWAIAEEKKKKDFFSF